MNDIPSQSKALIPRTGRYSFVSSGRGGARPGAGRPKGSHNKRTEEAIAISKEMGVNPVEFLLKAMANESLPMKDRIDCAKAVAPFVAPRLQSIEAHTTTGRKSHEELLEELDD